MNSKPLVIVALVMVSLALACQDNPTDASSTPPMAGRIESWQSDGNDNLYLTVSSPSSRLVLDSTRVAADGSFSIRVPFPDPPDRVLKQFAVQQDSNAHLSKQDLRSFSNPNVKYVELSMLVFDRHQLSRFLYSGNTFASSDSLTSVGDFRVTYYYFSEPTTISGSYQLTLYDSLLISQFGHSRFITDYSLSVSRGWNAITTTILSDVGQTRTYRVSAGDAVQKKWFAVWFVSRSFEFASTL